MKDLGIEIEWIDVHVFLIFQFVGISGTNILAYADHWGEKLAWFFGITSPKYYWELEEFKRMKAEEEERKKKEAEENFGWSEKGEESQVTH